MTIRVNEVIITKIAGASVRTVSRRTILRTFTNSAGFAPSVPAAPPILSAIDGNEKSPVTEPSPLVPACAGVAENK